MFKKEWQKDIIEIYKNLQEIIKELDILRADIVVANSTLNKLTTIINSQNTNINSEPKSLKIFTQNQNHYDELQEIALGNFGELEVNDAKR